MASFKYDIFIMVMQNVQVLMKKQPKVKLKSCLRQLIDAQLVPTIKVLKPFYEENKVCHREQ